MIDFAQKDAGSMNSGDAAGQFGTAVGEWLCEVAWPLVWRFILWCTAYVLVGFFAGIGLYLAGYVVNKVM